MPEQPTLSIKVTIAPQVAGGLHALVQKVLTRTTSPGGGGSPHNKVTGTVYGTVVQANDIHGGITLGR